MWNSAIEEHLVWIHFALICGRFGHFARIVQSKVLTGCASDQASISLGCFNPWDALYLRHILVGSKP